MRLTLTSQALDHKIWLPFMMPEQLTAEPIMVEVDRFVQSNDLWLFGDFHLNFIHTPLPFSGGWSRESAGCLEAYLTEKQCFIQICNKDNLCCAQAIVMANARLDHHPKWSSIRHGGGEQLRLARQLHFDACNDVFFDFVSLSHSLSHPLKK